MAADESNISYARFYSLGDAKSYLSQCQTAILDLSTESTGFTQDTWTNKSTLLRFLDIG